jgi:hypothetical protein
MRNEVLRDVLAGCAGVLAVAAVIGLPKDAAAVQHSQQSQILHARLLPHISLTRPQVPQLPARPAPPHVPNP